MGQATGLGGHQRICEVPTALETGKMRRVWILAVMLLAWSNFAGATVIISNAGTHTEASGVVDWFYNVALGSDQVFRRGDYFTIYDVPNIASVPDSVFFASVSGSFTPTIAGLTPPDPFGAVTNDDSGINNIKITSMTSRRTRPSRPALPISYLEL